MSGKPQFDEASVISAAVTVFWRHGYAATSISDLTEATGLSRSSLYQRFGDKEGLFREALAAYTDSAVQRMTKASAETARGRIEAILHSFVPDPSSSRPAGCMIARSCVERDELTEAGRNDALAATARELQILVAIIRQGVADAELDAGTDVDVLAWHFLAILQGVLNFPNAGADNRMLHRMIDTAMAVWPVL